VDVGNCGGDDEFAPEIDELIPLDGYTLSGSAGSGALGYFVAYNINASSNLKNDIDNNGAESGPFPSGSGKLQNDGSITIMIVKNRTMAWVRDTDVDQDMPPDSELDSAFHPFQMVDELSWSHRNGKEYTRNNFNEINENPDFQPDQVTRVFYWNDWNADRVDGRGSWWQDSTSSCLDTEIGDESWVYGENRGNNRVSQTQWARYDTRKPGGEARQSKSPTDPLYPFKYTCSATGDPDGTTGGTVNSGGVFQKDYDLEASGNYYLTPGLANQTLDANDGMGQIKFCYGDIDLDGDVDCADYNIVVALYNGGTSSADLDDTDMSGEYVYQGYGFQQVLLATELNISTSSETVQLADVQSHPFHGMSCDLGDVNGDGRVDLLDIEVVMKNIDRNPNGRIVGDVNRDGVIDASDIAIILNQMSLQR
jgi:hypothetical protein